MEGISPPPLTESPLSFSRKKIPKRTKNDVFVLNKVKNGPKRPYNRPKMYEKGQNIDSKRQKYIASSLAKMAIYRKKSPVTSNLTNRGVFKSQS